MVCVLGSGIDDRKTLGEILAVDRLVTRGTLGRRVRVTEVGTHIEESAVWPVELVGRMTRGSKYVAVGD